MLEETFRELYPGITDVCNAEQLANRFDRMRTAAQADSVPYTTWLGEVAMLTRDLGDLEITWHHSPNYGAWRQKNALFPPFTLDRHDGKWVMATVLDGEGVLKPGMQVDAINGENLDAYLLKNAPLLPTQSGNANVQAEWLEHAFSRHHTNFWERPEDYVIHSGDSTFKVHGLSIDELETGEMLARIAPRISFSADGTTGVLGLPSLDDQTLEQAGTPYAQSFKLAFATAQMQGLSDLIIDLRGVSNGKVKVVRELMRYLSDEPLLDSLYKTPVINITHQHYAFSSNMMEPKYLVKLMGAAETPNEAFKGRVHVITNGDNYGVAGLLVAALAKRDNTFLVGEQAPVFDWGIHHGQYLLQMPYSNIIVAIPSTRLIANKAAAGGSELVKLDHPLPDGPTLLEQVKALTQRAKS